MFQVFIKTFCIILGLFSFEMGVASETPSSLSVNTLIEGKHYQRLPADITAHQNIQDLMAESPNRIQVIEFFNYGCFWCGRLHPVLEEWSKTKPESTVFYRFPLAFNKKWEVLAKAFYVKQALGNTTIPDAQFFKAIHENHVDLSDEKLLQGFFVEQGVSQKTFQDLFRSFNISNAVAKANNIANAYRISASPVVIINGPSGSYLLSAKMVGSEQALVTVIDQLVSRESKKLAGS